MHAISITTKLARPMTIPQYAHDISHPARVLRRESFVRLRTLISTVESRQTSVRYPAFLVHTDDTGPSLRERGTVRGEGPSGEERTPGRSRPLELCSTEDHEHHLQNEAAMKSYYQLTLWRINRSRGLSHTGEPPQSILSVFSLSFPMMLCFPHASSISLAVPYSSDYGCCRDFPLD